MFCYNHNWVCSWRVGKWYSSHTFKEISGSWKIFHSRALVYVLCYPTAYCQHVDLSLMMKAWLGRCLWSLRLWDNSLEQENVVFIMNIIFHFSKNFSFLKLVDNEINSWSIQDYAFAILWQCGCCFGMLSIPMS